MNLDFDTRRNGSRENSFLNFVWSDAIDDFLDLLSKIFSFLIELAEFKMNEGEFFFGFIFAICTWFE